MLTVEQYLNFFFQYTHRQGQRLMIINGDKWKNLVTNSFLLSHILSGRLGKAAECPLKSLCSYVWYSAWNNSRASESIFMWFGIEDFN